MQPLRATRHPGQVGPAGGRGHAASPAAPTQPPTQPRRDPAPTRLAYRLSRMWLTPLYRSMVRVGIPAFVFITVVGWYFSNPTNRFAIVEKYDEIRSEIENRPEFQVKLLAVDGASPVLDAAIRQIVAVNFPISSFELDLDRVHAEITALDVVKEADVRIRPGGVLQIDVTERDPVLVWRAPGSIEMLDATGHRVASLTDRDARPDLPLVAGEGADMAVPEALTLLRTAAPLADRLRGLIRVGDRRWDLVLTGGTTILLPEEGAVAALEEVLALNQAQDLAERDLTHIDMRNPARPTLRLAAEAVEALHNIRSLSTE